MEDIQRFYVVLTPHGKSRYRMLVLGHERLVESGVGEIVGIRRAGGGFGTEAAELMLIGAREDAEEELEI